MGVTAGMNKVPEKEGVIMTFKGKTAAWWYIATAALNGVALAAAINQKLTVFFVGNLILLVLLDLFFVPVIFKNETVIGKKEIEIKFGLLTKTIPIQSITNVKVMKSYSASYAASVDRIGIESSTAAAAVFISLEDNDAFVKELMKKNRRIKYLI